MKKHFDKKCVTWLLLCVLCFSGGCIFRFALVGYDTLAVVMCAASLFCLSMCGFHHAEINGSRWPRPVRRIFLVLIALGLAAIVVVEAPIIAASRTDEREADYIIVLGAGLQGMEPSLSLQNRLYAALDYLERYPNCKAVLSGGRGEHEAITESQAMYMWLTNHGIHPDRLIKEEQASTTNQNISFSLSILRASGYDGTRIGIVSSEYHLYRALYLARQQGIPDPIGIAGRTTYPVLRINYFIREAFAVGAMWLGIVR